MFSKAEFVFLMSCVDAKPSENTQAGRNKGFMMMKLADQIDQIEKAEQEFANAPQKEPEKKPAAKPRARTKEKK